MCEPVTLAAIASAATGLGATSAGVMGALGTTAMTAGQAISLAATVGGTVLSAGSAYQQSRQVESIG